MFKLQKTVYRLLVLVFFCVLGQAGLRAQSVNDSVTVSLLTCSPGGEVYELYGHTAVLVSVPGAVRTDSVVFNYGVFDETQPNFIWRFMMGKTDYMVQAMPYFFFREEYERRGSEIICQQINLTQEEALTLFAMLQEECFRNNGVYRYNFLTNNCTSKSNDIVQAALEACGSRIRYKEQDKKTYRQSLHEYTQDSPWAQLGDDILLGANTDTLLDDHAMRFLPYHLKAYFDAASICDSMGTARPLVQQTVTLLAKRDVVREKGFPLSPVVCALIFLGIMLLLFALEYWTKHMMWGLDILLMPSVGAAGLLITFMFLFSEHPTLDSNWQIWVFNPLPLLCMPWVVLCAFKHKRCAYHYVYAAILTLFLIAAPWIPQTFSSVTVILALALLVRPLSYIFNFSRLKPRRVKPRKKK